jgi:predicted nuclease of predicted toxin-antitoxin system
MAKYLVDANLPYYFGLWNNPDFIFIKDINDSWTDERIWQYALENNLVILTKDSDFSHKVLYHGAPPKVIHFRIGNLRIKEFYHLIQKIWPEVEALVSENSLINVYTDRLEFIE